MSTLNKWKSAALVIWTLELLLIAAAVRQIPEGLIIVGKHNLFRDPRSNYNGRVSKDAVYFLPPPR